MFGCALCKKNGETEEFYKSHKLRDENKEVTCPVLKEFTCPLCHVKGDHTSSYCPMVAKNRSASATIKKQSPLNRKEESRPKLHLTTQPNTVNSSQQSRQQQGRRQQLIAPLPLPPRPKPAPSLPDANVGSPEKLEKLLNAANKMHILQRLAYLQYHGYSWDRFLALQTFINHCFIVI